MVNVQQSTRPFDINQKCATVSSELVIVYLYLTQIRLKTVL